MPAAGSAMRAPPQVRPDAYPPRATTHSHGRSGSTVLINLAIRLHRATIGHDISAEDEDLLVLFRRNSKEITSEPARWHPDHVAEWTQTISMQTSLLRPKNTTRGDGNGEFLRKEYEIVLVALPSHSAVALFSLDFADLAQSQPAGSPQLFSLTPRKCRDLAASLQVEITWEFANAVSTNNNSMQQSNSVSSMSLGPLSATALRGNPGAMSTRSKHAGSVVSSRSSHSSDAMLGDTSSTTACVECRSWRRKLERRDVQVQQLESFLKESQKRIDSLVFETEELNVREQAETQNAMQYRVLNMRLLQELEMAFQFCLQQMMAVEQKAKETGDATPPPFFMFLPEFEFMNRVKAFHQEMDTMREQENNAPEGVTPKANPEEPWRSFDFRQEMHAAIERNRALQHQLDFVCHSMSYDVPPEDEDWRTEDGNSTARPNSQARKLTGASELSDFSVGDGSSTARPSVSPVRTITEQLNALERENFQLKAQLESARMDSKSTQRSVSTSESAETTSSTESVGGGHVPPQLSSIHEEQEQARAELQRLQEEKDAVQRELDAVKSELEAARVAPVVEAPSETVESEFQLSADIIGEPERQRSSSAAASENSDAPVAETVEPTPTVGGNDFLSKIYADVGKAKIALEEEVKTLQQQLQAAHEENSKLTEQLQARPASGNGFVLLDDQMMADVARTESSLQLSVSTPAAASTDGQDDAERSGAALKDQVVQLQAVLEEKASLLKVHEQEVSFLKEHLTEKTKKLMEAESARETAEKALASAQQALAKAQRRITQLEIELEGLQHDHMRAQEENQHLSTNAARTDNHEEEIASLQKQLKLARQEAMQLRYRSNNLENVHERLEEALKEKKAVEIKLTTVEGQLFEQRKQQMAAPAKPSMESVIAEELQRQLDEKSEQLRAMQREVASLQNQLAAFGSQDDPATLDALEEKVTTLSNEITELCERNEDQAQRIETLSARVEQVTKEKRELESIVKELVAEVESLDSISSSPIASSVEDEESNKPPAVKATPAKSKPSTTARSVLSRYQRALRSQAEPESQAPAPSGPPEPVPVAKVNKVAHLIRNFSSTSNSATSSPNPPRRASATTGVKILTPTGDDARRRQESAPPHYAL